MPDGGNILVRIANRERVDDVPLLVFPIIAKISKSRGHAADG